MAVRRSPTQPKPSPGKGVEKIKKPSVKPYNVIIRLTDRVEDYIAPHVQEDGTVEAIRDWESCLAIEGGKEEFYIEGAVAFLKDDYTRATSREILSEGPRPLVVVDLELSTLTQNLPRILETILGLQKEGLSKVTYQVVGRAKEDLVSIKEGRSTIEEDFRKAVQEVLGGFSPEEQRSLNTATRFYLVIEDSGADSIISDLPPSRWSDFSCLPTGMTLEVVGPQGKATLEGRFDGDPSMDPLIINMSPTIKDEKSVLVTARAIETGDLENKEKGNNWLNLSVPEGMRATKGVLRDVRKWAERLKETLPVFEVEPIELARKIAQKVVVLDKGTQEFKIDLAQIPPIQPEREPEPKYVVRPDTLEGLSLTTFQEKGRVLVPVPNIPQGRYPWKVFLEVVHSTDIPARKVKDALRERLPDGLEEELNNILYVTLADGDFRWLRRKREELRRGDILVSSEEREEIGKRIEERWLESQELQDFKNTVTESLKARVYSSLERIEAEVKTAEGEDSPIGIRVRALRKNWEENVEQTLNKLASVIDDWARTLNMRFDYELSVEVEDFALSFQKMRRPTQTMVREIIDSESAMLQVRRAVGKIIDEIEILMRDYVENVRETLKAESSFLQRIFSPFTKRGSLANTIGENYIFKLDVKERERLVPQDSILNVLDVFGRIVEEEHGKLPDARERFDEKLQRVVRDEFARKLAKKIGEDVLVFSPEMNAIAVKAETV